MIIEDILNFERIEAQELVGHLDILERAFLGNNFKADLDSFQVQCPLILEALKRGELYRFIELKEGAISEKNANLYAFLKMRVKCDQSINLGNIPLFKAIKYELHYPCLMAPEEGLYGANFPEESILYIFNTRDVLYNLVLDGYVLPRNVQNGLGINQRSDKQKETKYSIRNLVAQTLAHIAFSLENRSLKWDQQKISNLDIMKNFDLCLNLTEKGGKRPLRDAIQKIIPDNVRKRGNRKMVKFTDTELALEPLTMPNIIYTDKSIDFKSLKIVLRTAFLLKKGLTPKGEQFLSQDVYKLPALRQLTEKMNENELLILNYELNRYASKFGQSDYFPI